MSEQPQSPPKQAGSTDSNGLWSIFSAIAALAVTAIFFIAGWVYESYWYGFYGISLTQINVQPQQIMIEGVPGILLISFPILIIAIFIALTEKSGRKDTESPNGNRLGAVPQIILSAFYFATVLFWIIAFINNKFLYPVPVEVLVSVIGITVIIVATFLLILLLNYRRYLNLQKRVLSRFSNVLVTSIAMMISLALQSISTVDPYKIPISILAALVSKAVIDTVLNRSTHSRRPDIRPSDANLNDAVENPTARKEAEPESSRFVSVFVDSWKAWIGIVLLFLLFISVGISALLGRVDAQHGRRLMMGGWKISETYVYSSQTELPLPALQDKNIGEGSVYGPFALIASDDQAYYFANWKSTNYYVSRPTVYVIPRSSDPSLMTLIQPEQMKTPQPTPVPTSELSPTATNVAVPTFTP